MPSVINRENIDAIGTLLNYRCYETFLKTYRELYILQHDIMLKSTVFENEEFWDILPSKDRNIACKVASDIYYCYNKGKLLFYSYSMEVFLSELGFKNIYSHLEDSIIYFLEHGINDIKLESQCELELHIKNYFHNTLQLRGDFEKPDIPYNYNSQLIFNTVLNLIRELVRISLIDEILPRKKIGVIAELSKLIPDRDSDMSLYEKYFQYREKTDQLKTEIQYSLYESIGQVDGTINGLKARFGTNMNMFFKNRDTVITLADQRYTPDISRHDAFKLGFTIDAYMEWVCDLNAILSQTTE